MKKLFAILLMMPLLWACSSSDNDDSSANNNQALTSVVVTRHNYKFGEVEKFKSKTVSAREFDTNGLLTHFDTLTINWQGEEYFKYKYSYKYDNDNRLIEAIKKSEFGSTLEKSVYEYNKSDNSILEKMYLERGLKKTINRFYGSGDKLLKEEERDVLTPSIGYDHVYKYSGSITEKESYRLDGSLFYRYEFHYDSNNNLLKQINISPEGKEQIIKDAAYTYSGNKVAEKTWIGAHGQKHKAVYTYKDDKLSKIKFMDADSNEIRFIHIFEYIYS